MADLSITATDVAPVQVVEQITGPAGAAITQGQVVYLVAATGVFGLADQDESAPLNHPAGVAITGANAANITITAVRKGILDLGDALSAFDYDAIVYLSGTPGGMSATDAGNTIVAGRVVPGWGATTADKLLRVDL